MQPNKAIQTKLIGAFIILTFLISSLYGILVFNAMKYTEDDILNQRLLLESEYFIEQYQRNPLSAKLPKSKGFVSYLSSSPDLPEWLANEPIGSRELHDLEVHVGIFNIPNSSEKLYLSLEELTSSSLEKDLSTLFMVLIFVGALITVIGLIIGLFFSKVISKPIILLTRDVENTRRDANKPFYGDERNDEVGALSRSFTLLVKRLQDFLSREQQFTRYASHELRTPISLIKNALAVLKLPNQDNQSQARNLSRVESATIELESLVSTFLALGREEDNLSEQSVDIAEMIQVNIDRNTIVAKNKRFDIIVNIKEQAPTIKVNKALVEILIDNIIRNIYTHGGTGAIITIGANSIIFENSIPIANDVLEKEIRQSYGNEIVEKIAQRLKIKLHHEMDEKQYKTVLVFA